MRLKSRGLGRKELVMDFREYEVVREGDELVVVGTIRDPVNWDFTIRVCEDDVVGMTKLILRPSMIRLLLRSLFKPRNSSKASTVTSVGSVTGRSASGTVLIEPSS